MAWYNALLFVITSGIASQFENLGDQVLDYGSQIDRSTLERRKCFRIENKILRHFYYLHQCVRQSGLYGAYDGVFQLGKLIQLLCCG
jgi:hypothetical protein